MSADYEEIIKKLSSAYGKKGRIGHDEELGSLRKDIEESKYDIVSRVVKGYLSRDRIFGIFPERAIKDLVAKCIQLEREKSNIPFQ